MHYSAKRGLAITCRLSVRPSVCPSVCDVGGLWSHRLEFLENISRLVSVGRSLCGDRNIVDLLQGEQLEIWAQSDSPPVDLSVGDIRSQIAAEWLQIAQWSQWRAYRKPPSLFRMVPSLMEVHILRPPLPPKWGSHMPHEYANGHISATGDPIHFMFDSKVYRVFRVCGSNGAISGCIKSKMAASCYLGKFWMAVSPQRVILSTSC